LNYYGSHRRLLGNSRSAIVAAIEIYNKPRFSYRNEVFVQLLINSWELFFKALLSKNRQKIYYPKKRDTSYRTLSLNDAYNRSLKYWPSDIDYEAVWLNIAHLQLYRDKAVHFYNVAGFGSVVYMLAQTSIKNYHDMQVAIFGVGMDDEINWELLPLSFAPSKQAIDYLSGSADRSSENNPAVQDFLQSLRDSSKNLEASEGDTGRLLTIIDVSLHSTKKLKSADIAMGIQSSDSGSYTGAIVVSKKVDPNDSYPFRQKELLSAASKKGKELTPYDFQSIVYKYNMRPDTNYCWKDKLVNTYRWSPAALQFVLSLTDSEIQEARAEYGSRS
jgi:hypothetical protein